MPLWQVALEIPVFYKQFSIHAMYLFGIFFARVQASETGALCSMGTNVMPLFYCERT
jgi:hypothetical protein